MTVGGLCQHTQHPKAPIERDGKLPLHQEWRHDSRESCCSRCRSEAKSMHSPSPRLGHLVSFICEAWQVNHKRSPCLQARELAEPAPLGREGQT